MVSLVAEHRFQGTQASAVATLELENTDSVVVVDGLHGSMVCAIFPDQGLNPCPLHQQADSLPLSHQGRPVIFFF